MMVFFPANLAYFFMEFGNLRKKVLELMALQVLLWDCLHWQFTYYYLETAALFRLTFQSHNDADFARVKRRQGKLHRVQALGYLVLVVQFCAYITVVWIGGLSSTDLMAIQSCIQSCVNTTMTVITLMSMYHIDRSSKSVQSFGVKPNSILMKLYVVFWGGMALFIFVQAALWIFIANSPDPDEASVQRMYTAMPFFAITV